MKRGEIKSYIRILADELTEAPEGLFLNTELDILINVSQQNVAVALAPYIPWAITKTFLISTTANKREYSLGTDLSLTDFFLMQGIFHNEADYPPKELLYLEGRDQVAQFRTINKTGEPRAWSWESAEVIALDPTPPATVSDKYKGVYIPLFKDLNDDATHDPATSKYAIPFNGSTILTPAHPLIAAEVLKQWAIRAGGQADDVDAMYSRLFDGILFTLTQAQGTTHRGRPHITEIIKT